MDPWTQSFRRTHNPCEVVREDGEGTVIKYDGVEITLDSGIVRSEISDIQLQDQTIFVSLNDHSMFVLPRDKPYCRHLLALDGRADDFPGPLPEMGDVVVHREDLGDYEYQFSLVDLDTKTTTFICENANPAASYNGLMWFSVGGFLAPLFVDLKDPGVAC